MTDLIPMPRAVMTKANLVTKVRTLVAEHLGVDVEDINLNSHFADDLGLDPLDVLELVILVEERFPNLEVMEGGELSFFDDLIEQIQFLNNQTARMISWNSENRIPQQSKLSATPPRHAAPAHKPAPLTPPASPSPQAR
jgi:acyl carrier protein